MILNLSRYQINQPYPEVKKVKRDSNLLSMLLGGYCGERSELTTVLQYSYHSICCENKFLEVASTMRGIFHVETLHMQFLGECVEKLGGDPRYILPLQEKSVYWQASLVEYHSSPVDMLLADIEGEKFAAEYYQKLAETVRQGEIARLMARLAKDELLHVRMLTELYHKHFQE